MWPFVFLWLTHWTSRGFDILLWVHLVEELVKWNGMQVFCVEGNWDLWNPFHHDILSSWCVMDMLQFATSVGHLWQMWSISQCREGWEIIWSLTLRWGFIVQVIKKVWWCHGGCVWNPLIGSLMNRMINSNFQAIPFSVFWASKIPFHMESTVFLEECHFVGILSIEYCNL